jgi:hypothetical protein
MIPLVISGCSWSCGEVLPPMLQPWKSFKWSTLNPRTMITHPGLAAYLEDAFDIINISQCAASNWQNLWTIKNFYESNVGWQSARWLLFQTDFLRNEAIHEWQIDYGKMQSSMNFEDFHTSCAQSFYQCANELAASYNIKIHMCGGLTDLDRSLMQGCDNLVPVHDSWIGLFNPKHIVDLKCLEPPTTRLLAITKKVASHEFMMQLFDHIDRSREEFDLLLGTGYFGPAYGNFHPNRHGHKFMADIIRDFFTGNKS